MLEILLADDDQAMTQLLGKALRVRGHRVTMAFDGPTALEEAATHSFDVLICDVRMPHVDGVSLMKRVHAFSPQTAVILMTAHPDVRQAVGALHDGAYEFLLKPFAMSELLGCLRKLDRPGPRPGVSAAEVPESLAARVG